MEEFLKEKGGYQDQLFAAYGGFNHIKFNTNGTYKVNRFQLDEKIKEKLTNKILLCYLPQKRLSYLNSVDNFIDQKSVINNLIKIKNAVSKAMELLQSSILMALENYFMNHGVIRESYLMYQIKVLIIFIIRQLKMKQ